MSLGVNAMMWRTQDVLHKRPEVVPGAILAITGSLIVYRHVTHVSDDPDGDFLKSFLTMSFLQMLPLVALEMKIMRCADPVGLFYKFATPVTLIHVFFLSLRLVLLKHESTTLWYSALAVAGGIFVMVKEYRQSWRSIIECQAVWNLIMVAFLAAVVTTTTEMYLHPAYHMGGPGVMTLFDQRHIENIILMANNYIELAAFLPAVWMIYREHSGSSRVQVESTDTKRTSTAFFVFLVGFYVAEDLHNAYASYEFSGLVSIANIVHLALVVDFACYVGAHFYNPEKLIGELRKWLPVDIHHEV